MAIVRAKAASDSYWLTRFVLLRWLGFIYVFAFYAAVRQLVPLVGHNGLTPADAFLQQIRDYNKDPLSLSWPGLCSVAFALLDPLLGWLAASGVVDRPDRFRASSSPDMRIP